MGISNKNLNRAKAEKNDEFYTRVEDVITEIGRSDYTRYFDGASVLCNCNDTEYSGFYQFFNHRFDLLGLQRLTSVSYNADGSSAYMIEKTADHTEKVSLTGNGDFRSAECIDLLNQADIVCTNPPFSIFRQYLALLTEYEKKFIIMGNINACSKKDVFPLFRDKKVWFGYSTAKEFYSYSDGIRPVSAAWYTNLEIDRCNESLPLTRDYEWSKKLYTPYDNYNAIDVSTVKDIPATYNSEMGVPISFLLYHNPNQFDLIGTSGELAGPVTLSDGSYSARPGRFYIDGRRLYDRIVIKKRV